MKRLIIILMLAGTAFLLLSSIACIKGATSEELKASMEVTDVETKWTSKYYQPWPPRLILVPVLSFRVKNLTSKPLTYINFNVVFRFKEDNENLGDSFLAAIRGTPVLPGEKSDVITLKSNFGVDGKNLNSFKSNPRWKIVEARLFTSSRGSSYIQIGEYQISQTIDFKEPEPVHMGEEKKEAKEKK